MVEGGNRALTEGEIVQLAEAIAARYMESIALKYVGLSPEYLDNLTREHNRGVLRKWAYKNSSPDQVQVSNFEVSSENHTLSQYMQCVDTTTFG